MLKHKAVSGQGGSVRQLDPGTYRVLQRTSSGETLAGRVYAEGTAGDMVTEHWALYSNFASPSSSGDMVVEQVPSNEEHTSLSAFVSKARDEAGTSTVEYVKATCEYFTDLP